MKILSPLDYHTLYDLVKNNTTEETLRKDLANFSVEGMGEEDIGSYLIEELDAVVKRILPSLEKYHQQIPVSTSFILRGESGKGPGEINTVWLDGEKLSIEESQQYHNHSEEFSWGYGGSGPAQLALAICIKLFGVFRAGEMYQDFKWNVVAKLPSATDFKATLTYVGKKSVGPVSESFSIKEVLPLLNSQFLN